MTDKPYELFRVEEYTFMSDGSVYHDHRWTKECGEWMWDEQKGKMYFYIWWAGNSFESLGVATAAAFGAKITEAYFRAINKEMLA